MPIRAPSFSGSSEANDDRTTEGDNNGYIYV